MATDYDNHISMIRIQALDVFFDQAPPPDDPALCWRLAMEGVEQTAADINATAMEISAGVREAVDIYCLGPGEDAA